MTPWVRRIMAINVAVFFLQLAVPQITPPLILVPALVLERPWTPITYMFLHGGFFHILFNMLALFWFGGRVEQRLGGRQFVALYLISGVGGALLSFATPHVAILGASGAIMGVMIAYAMYWPRQRFYFYGVVPVEAWLLVAIYVVVAIWGAGGLGGAGTAHFAHLGGFGTGFLYLKWLEWRSPGRRWAKKVAGSAPTPANGPSDGDLVRRWRDIRVEGLHPVNRDEIARLLKKIQAAGMSSLTLEERATLDRFSSLTS